MNSPELLNGVTAEKAVAKLIANSHSIWEIVHHLAAWNTVVRRRLEGERVEAPDEGDWSSVKDMSGTAWRMHWSGSRKATVTCRKR